MDTDLLIQRLKEMVGECEPDDVDTLLEAIRQLKMFKERHSINRPNPLFGTKQ